MKVGKVIKCLKLIKPVEQKIKGSIYNSIIYTHHTDANDCMLKNDDLSFFFHIDNFYSHTFVVKVKFNGMMKHLNLHCDIKLNTNSKYIEKMKII